MSRFELRSAEFTSLKFQNKSPIDTYSAGELISVDGVIGVVVENVGIAGTEISAKYPNGSKGVVVYDAEKIALPKLAAAAFKAGDAVYYCACYRRATSVEDGSKFIGYALGDADKETHAVLARLTQEPAIYKHESLTDAEIAESLAEFDNLQKVTGVTPESVGGVMPHYRRALQDLQDARLELARERARLNAVIMAIIKEKPWDHYDFHPGCVDDCNCRHFYRWFHFSHDKTIAAIDAAIEAGEK